MEFSNEYTSMEFVYLVYKIRFVIVLVQVSLMIVFFEVLLRVLVVVRNCSAHQIVVFSAVVFTFF